LGNLLIYVTAKIFVRLIEQKIVSDNSNRIKDVIFNVT
jgi:hypothetical protein